MPRPLTVTLQVARGLPADCNTSGRARGLPRPEDEKVLCSVCMDANHILTVTPAFNASSPHVIENSDGDVWEYVVQQVICYIYSNRGNRAFFYLFIDLFIYIYFILQKYNEQ